MVDAVIRNFAVIGFGMDRKPFVLRLLAGGLIVGLIVALAVFL
jgi:hypothetical protein